MFHIKRSLLMVLLAAAYLQPALSVTKSDDFTQPTNLSNWAPLASACLTAGTASNNNTSAASTDPTYSSIPGCNYSTPDAAGSGALRLTQAAGSQHGAIVSKYTFPSTQGLQVTFTTYAYGGSSDGPASDGADGLSFFLMDGSVATTLGGQPNIGAWGGSLAYTCSNVNSPYTGLTGGYLGLGMDEYGNFLNGANAVIYIADYSNNRIRQLVRSGTSFNIATVAGTGTAGSAGDGGSATSAKLNRPTGIAVDLSNNLYIADSGNNKIRNVTSGGNISTIAGTGTSGFSGDGAAATSAKLNNPKGVAVDMVGNVFIADYGNNRIRRVDSTSGAISTIAGTGTAGFSGDGSAATAAQLNGPVGVAVDASGNVYIADQANNRIRRVTAAGIISTVAGNGTAGSSGDGAAATLANLNAPVGVAAGPDGTVYITDSTNRVRAISSAGTITTLAGTGTAGFAGDGGNASAAQLSVPYGVGVDAAGNVFIADQSNQRIRQLSTGGTIQTIAGTGSSGFSGDNGVATSGQINTPYGIAVYGDSTNDNTASGIPIQTTSSSTKGYNSFVSGTNQQANRIGLRGAGNVSWYWLNQNYPQYYPSTLSSSQQQAAVQSACKTGLLSDYAGATSQSINFLSVSGSTLTVGVPSVGGYVIGDGVTLGGGMSSSSGTIPGPYTLKTVDVANNRFTVNLSSSPATVTNVSGTVVNTSLPSGGRLLTTAVRDYPVIPGGYLVLPSTSLLAKEGTSTRSGAWPIKYQLTITPSGLLSLNYSYNGGVYQSVLSNWPITAANGPLPSSFRFGFAGSTGGSTNVHEISCFVAQPVGSSSSAGANTVQAGQVRTGTQVYLASYDPNGWSGSLVAKDLTTNSSGVAQIATNAAWDANCGLTGGLCASMGVDSGGVPTHSVTVEGPSARTLLTWNGTSGAPMSSSGLTSAQKTILNSTDSNGTNRLSWLRGDRTQEQGASGPLRTRAGVLGDMVDSSPTWVGPPTNNYSASFVDTLYGSTGGESSYTTFSTALATRQNVVYVGANDGYLHGFRAGSKNSNGTNNSTNDDGYEVIGFAPVSVLANTNVVELTNPTYGHQYFVDAAPSFGDLYYNNAWHTWLVGGMGPGGAEIYALDITDPTGVATASAGVSFSEVNASSVVVGSWTSSTLASCVSVSGNCGNNLGFTYGTPLIRRLHNGKWAVIFGNGYGSVNNHAGIYVGVVNSSTGALSFYWLDTGSGSSGSPNGIAYPSSADFDGDHVTDYIYAGDLLGNVWRFDLTSSNPADWGASKYGQSTATPLFVAKNASGATQPITTKIAVTVTYTGGAQRVILGLGTGRAVPFTALAPTSYAPGVQTVYGLWDWDMNAWNSGTTTSNSVSIPANAAKLASLAQITSSPYRTFTRANDLVNTVAVQTASTSTTSGTRTLPPSTVCWNGSAACSSGNTQYGWIFDLPDTNEQVIYNPVFSGGELFLNTLIPPVNSASSCTTALPTGWTMSFNIGSGGGEPQNIFPDPVTGAVVVTSGNYSIAGLQQNAVGTPYVVSVGSQQYVVNQTVGGAPTVKKINPQGGVKVKQVSWEQLR